LRRGHGRLKAQAPTMVSLWEVKRLSGRGGLIPRGTAEHGSDRPRV
jgi:hypothetical protein